MREKEGYRDVLERIREKYEHELLSVPEVSEFTGYGVRYVTSKYCGWEGNSHGKRIPATVLARQLCG